MTSVGADDGHVSDTSGQREVALTAFLDDRVRAGYTIETQMATHAVIAPGRWLSLKQAVNPFRRERGRQVVSVDDEGVVTTSVAEPVRF